MEYKAREIKNLKEIPPLPGVYLMKDENGNVIYVGKAKNLANRIPSYFHSSTLMTPATFLLAQKARTIELIVVDNEFEALELEANLISHYEPRYNIRLKDNKHYPYIKITVNELFPRVSVVRERKKDGAIYFGPYTDVGNMRRTLRIAREMFGIRDCKLNLPARKPIKPCLNLQIGKCLGPCINSVSVDEYRNAVADFIDFLRGKRKRILAKLHVEMMKKARAEEFEKAILLRDKLKVIERFLGQTPIELDDAMDRDFLVITFRDNIGVAVIFQAREGAIIDRKVQIFKPGVKDYEEDTYYTSFVTQYYIGTPDVPQEIVVPARFPDMRGCSHMLTRKTGKQCRVVLPTTELMKKILRLARENADLILQEQLSSKLEKKVPLIISQLQKELNLPRPPLRIEAFDVSNIQGKWATGSLVTFVSGRPRKSDYRHFKIISKDNPDDFAMIKEIVYRRYKRVMEEGKELPDLILIDGGAGQLASANEALSSLNLEGKIPVIALAKKLEEIYLPNSTTPINIPRYSLALKLLQRVRNEAHRFAVEYHKKLRGSSIEAKILRQVSGIGEIYQKRLLEKFSSIEEIAKTDPKTISEKTGIPVSVASRLVEFLSKSPLVYYF